MKNFGILLVRLNLMIFISFVNLSCGSNVLQSVGSHSSDEAIMDDIESYQRKDQFDLAIAKFDELSVAKLAETATQVYKASVYADACGLQFITMLTSLSDLSSSKLFQVLENTMKGSTKAKIDYCIAAEEIMLTLDAAGKLGVGEYLFLVTLSLGKIGAILSTYTDKDGNGTVDAGIDPCATEPDDDPADPTNNGFPTTYAKHIATGLSVLQVGLAGIGSEATDATNTTSTLMTALCTALDSVDAGVGAFNFCGITSIASITSDHEKGVRSMVKESDALGLGTCTGDITTCNCP